MAHLAGAHVADDLVVAMLVHPHHKARLQLGVINGAESAKAGITRLSERDAWTDAAELEGTMRPLLMGFRRYAPCSGDRRHPDIHFVSPYLQRAHFG
ncbi:hypothetical protein [Ochrobactrum sp. MYb379]|uniref:hypothetical protein n=1 Tax=Ochrobactrum sp. MYb379 TaxID=2745275 RepID=UPI00309EC7E7